MPDDLAEEKVSQFANACDSLVLSDLVEVEYRVCKRNVEDVDTRLHDTQLSHKFLLFLNLLLPPVHDLDKLQAVWHVKQFLVVSIFFTDVFLFVQEGDHLL